MAENKDGQEKTEPASAKRIREARARGQTAKSMDVTTAAVLLVGGVIVFLMGSPMMADIQKFMRIIFIESTNIELTTQNISAYYFKFILFFIKLILPIVSLIFLIVLIAEISQTGLHIATKKFTEGLNFKRIFNPLSGLKKIFFSGRSVFELTKSLIKIFILGFVVYDILEDKVQETIDLIEKPISEIGAFLASVSLEVVAKVGAVYILIAVADMLYQRYRYKEDLKMTKQEVKEENKQAEGDPRVKARLRSIMRSRIRKLMLKNVKTADVVITNPTHYAVALAYDSAKMSAPVVVAKGADYLAAQIRQIAEENLIPIVEQPPLARALFFSTDVDMEIPENLFKAVAQVLAYVYQLKRKDKRNRANWTNIYRNNN
ncbi:MAG: flagellar biosynthesis protein FlhB [Candidatus Kapabacteria bacterium]|nr:flagellar biosynthesis protein FlhB [Candidatus Kapabacteria bacterium]